MYKFPICKNIKREVPNKVGTQDKPKGRSPQVASWSRTSELKPIPHPQEALEIRTATQISDIRLKLGPCWKQFLEVQTLKIKATYLRAHCFENKYVTA